MSYYKTLKGTRKFQGGASVLEYGPAPTPGSVIDPAVTEAYMSPQMKNYLRDTGQPMPVKTVPMPSNPTTGIQNPAIKGNVSTSPLTYGPKPVNGPDGETRLEYMHPEKRREELLRIQKNLAAGQTIPQEDKDLLNAAYKKNNPNKGMPQMTDDPELVKKYFPGGNKEEVVPAPIVKTTPETVKNASPEELVDALDRSLNKAKDPEAIKELQRNLGVKDDGFWGPKSQAAFDKQRRGLAATTKKGIEESDKIKYIQRRLGVKADGMWGPITQVAFDKMKAKQGRLGVEQDGVRGKNTNAAIYANDKDFVADAQARAAQINKGDIIRPDTRRVDNRSRGEMRKDARQDRREDRRAERQSSKDLRKLSREIRKDPNAKEYLPEHLQKVVGLRRRGGIFYNTID